MQSNVISWFKIPPPLPFRPSDSALCDNNLPIRHLLFQLRYIDLINSRRDNHSLHAAQGGGHQLVDWHSAISETLDENEMFPSCYVASRPVSFVFSLFREINARSFFRLIWTYLYYDLKWSKYRCKKQRWLVIKVSWSRTNRRKSQVPGREGEGGNKEAEEAERT